VVRASVSRLARLRPLSVGGRELGSETDSIWNGNELNPEDAVESREPVDRPTVCLSGRGGGFRESFVTVVVLGSAVND
jgi:hypothetical protein